MKKHRGYEEWPFLQWLQPLVRYLRSSIEEFPSGPFVIFCIIIGGIGGYFVGKEIAHLFAIKWEDLPTVVAFCGGVSGFICSLIFIDWLAKD